LNKPYEAMSTAERWQWHADVYAFRRVVLGIAPEEHTSPCDVEGKWFDEVLVSEAERRLRNRRAVKYSANRRDDSDVWEARGVENKWAQDRGYNDFEHYKLVERIDHVDACVRVANSFVAAMQKMPGSDDRKLNDPHAVAATLGVKAREYTPEELRAGRIALGLERAEAAE
jgi:hypothetical protein